MFAEGNYYLEKVTTGRLTFAADGTPSISPMERESVFRFYGKTAGESLKDSPLLVPGEALKPATEYMRLFRAPVTAFDSLGALKEPAFETVGFLEATDEMYETIQNVDKTPLFKKLSEPVLPYFTTADELRSVMHHALDHFILSGGAGPKEMFKVTQLD